MTVDPCSVCGSKDLNLIDGYYYCVECGTQDKNVRETVIEQQFFADGTFAQTTKRKILIKDERVEMTGEWYKWHTFNFILNGLADELIALGAEPSFKTKLLWIWTKYVKKYQRKEDIGLSQVNETENTIIPLAENTNVVASDEETNDDGFTKKTKTKYGKPMAINDIKNMSSGLLLSMVYVALNLDKSDIQISHLLRFIEESRLNISNYDRHIPMGINVKSIPCWQEFKSSCFVAYRLSSIRCRITAMRLCKELDLGPPLVPDMRKIIDNFTTELCLPLEFKNLVFSLMHLWPCNFLDVDNRAVKTMSKFPDYECNAIAYILIGLKMCFGLDDDYEYRLSDAVEKFNEMEKFSKCYKVGFAPEPTGRLFSFREWISFLQFRRKMLTKHRIVQTNDEHYMDVDDYIFMEYLKERPKENVNMTDELSMDIINKLNLDKDIDVIPKEYFPATLTPLTTYTEVLSRNCRHTQDVELLSEDFTQYSLIYACESLHLSNLQNDDNLIVGVNDTEKTVTGDELLCGYLKGIKTSKGVEMIYVRNCQNKNWLKTNKPTMEHVIINSNDKDSKHDDDSDHGYDSNVPSTPGEKDENEGQCEEREQILGIDKGNDIEGQSEESDLVLGTDKDNKIEGHCEESELVRGTDKDDNLEKQCEESEPVLETITEEDDDQNIFDDSFEVIVDKQESMQEMQDNHDFDNVDNNMIEPAEDNFQQSDEEDRKSIASTEFCEFNPETFDRERAIKELILNACKKYKIPIPKEYRTIEVRKRKRDDYDNGGEPQRKQVRSKRGEVKQKVHKLLEAYYSHLEKDFLAQTSHQLSILINNMTQTKPEDDHVYDDAVENLNNSEPNNSSIHGYTNVSEISAIVPDHTQINISKMDCENENAEATLFNEDSDCENIEDFTSKTDPKFDAAKYDVDQLYIKLDDAEPEDLYESLLDPEIDKILEKKMEECDQTEITVKARCRRRAASDSDDEIPLSVIQQEKEAYTKEVYENESLSPLITNNIPEFKYWVKIYNTTYMAKETNVLEKFDSEMTETMPKTFSFLLKECVVISGCSQFNIYKCLQNLERNLVCCARRRD